jgi:dTDP-4-dehydrorhamnose 3,5-epimerase
MIITETELPGAYVIEQERRYDARGFFARIWSEREFAERGLETHIAQCSLSHNKRTGTLRGLHFQRAPHEEVKLVRCTKGTIHDIIVDLRPDSSTFRQWMALELEEDDRRSLYVPRGFAHGFQTLTEYAEVFYMISEPHAPEAAAGVRWNDPAFGIEWPLGEPAEISERDRSWPDFFGRSLEQTSS